MKRVAYFFIALLLTFSCCLIPSGATYVECDLCNCEMQVISSGMVGRQLPGDGDQVCYVQEYVQVVYQCPCCNNAFMQNDYVDMRHDFHFILDPVDGEGYYWLCYTCGARR